MKNKLSCVYEKRKAELEAIMNFGAKDKITAPLLISPNEKYERQPNRLLIVGQETCGWGCSEEKRAAENFDLVSAQMDFYEKFNVGENYNSPFWSVTRKVENVLENEPFSCAWTNISKFDVNGSPATGELKEKISVVDDLILSEIEIIQPKVCLFFTSNKFDERIKKIYTGIKFIEINNCGVNKFYKLEHEKLPPLTFKSYHPKYLRIKKMENNFLAYIKSLV